MDDDILIEVKLDDREITRQMDNLSRKLQKSLDAAVGRPTGGGADRVTKTFKDQEAAALKLAQAQARLAAASGDLSRAENTLSTALAGVNKQTLTSINAQTQLAQVHQRMSRTLKEMAENLTNIGSRLTVGLTAPLGALAIAAVKTATDFDSLKRGLISVSGSSAEAEKQLVRLKEVAKLPGLGFKEAIQGSINLQAAGFSAERAERSLKAFGNALATVGKGKAELDGVILALTQIESKGKVSAEEINQLAERVPQIRKAMIAAFGTADTEIIQKAKITSGKFIDAVVTQLEKLPKVTGGAKNTFENLKDSIEQSLLPLGNKLLQTIIPAIEKLSPKILGLLEGFQKLNPQVQTLAIGFGAAAFAAGPLIGALGEILKLVTAIRALGGVGGVLGGLGTLGKIGLTGAAIGGVGAAVLMSARDATTTEQAVRDAGPVPSAFRRQALEQLRRQQASRGDLAAFGLTPSGVANALRGVPPPPADSPIIDAKKLAEQNAKRQGQKSELDKARDEVKQLTQKVKALGDAESALGVELAKIDVLRAKIELGKKARDDARFKEAKRQLGIPLAPELPGGIGLPKLALTAVGAPGGVAGPAGIAEPTENAISAAATRGDLANARLRIQEVQIQIQNQVNRGLVTEAEAQRQLAAARRASRDELIAALQQERESVGVGSLRGLQITEEIEQLRFLGVELSNNERFMRGFNSQVETVGDAFDRFGANVARAFGNVRDLFNGLKQAVLGFFNDLLGNALQNLVRSTLGGLFGGTSGVGGVFRSIFGGISAPPSVSAASTGPNLANLFGIGFGQGLSPVQATGSVASIAGVASSFSTSAFGQSLVGLAPLIGIQLGASLGGKSVPGQILGAAGGSGILGALFAPFALVGAALFGKASQRHKDEEASGVFLKQALDAIDQLAAAIAADQVDGAQARAIFDSQILGTFRQQISGLKTASVVKSRLTNQVRDLEAVYQARIPPLIAEQQRRRITAEQNALVHSRLIPEFATGGTTLGGLALLHRGEKVLNLRQQAAVISQSNPQVFERAGVPGVQRTPVFDGGGTFGGGSLPIEINLEAQVVIGKDDATRIVLVGANSPQGRAVTVNNIKVARTNREL